MADPIDIKKVIQGSTSDMTLDTLTKKGVKQVKVLDQATITRLITEAIDRILHERAEGVSEEERRRIIQETKDQLNVESLKKGIQAANEAISDKDRRNRELEAQLSQFQSLADENRAKDQRLSELEAQLQVKEQLLDEQRKKGDGGLAQVLALLSSQMQQGAAAGGANVAAAIESLTKKIERMPVGGGGGGGGHNVPVPDEVALDFLVQAGEALESNIDDVKVKQAKAGDVKGALDKLKKLQKGGE